VRLAPLGLAALLGVAAGCADPGEVMFPVSGKVTLEGTPLNVGAVSFRPDAARGNKSMHIPTGEIDPQGRYELITAGRKGAPPGWYKVLVFADANVQPNTVPTRLLPPRWLMNVKYTNDRTTDLSVEVVEKPGPEAYDLKLSK
jgi:hypothetical protein